MKCSIGVIWRYDVFKRISYQFCTPSYNNLWPQTVNTGGDLRGDLFFKTGYLQDATFSMTHNY